MFSFTVLWKLESQYYKTLTSESFTLDLYPANKIVPCVKWLPTVVVGVGWAWESGMFEKSLQGFLSWLRRGREGWGCPGHWAAALPLWPLNPQDVLRFILQYSPLDHSPTGSTYSWNMSNMWFLLVVGSMKACSSMIKYLRKTLYLSKLFFFLLKFSCIS